MDLSDQLPVAGQFLIAALEQDLDALLKLLIARSHEPPVPLRLEIVDDQLVVSSLRD